MNLQHVRVHIEYHSWSGALNLYITALDFDGRRKYLAKPVALVYEPIEEGVMYPEPTLKINESPFDRKDGKSPFLEALKEGLENSGYAVTFNEQTTGELKATKYHLEDMRILSLNKKGKKDV